VLAYERAHARRGVGVTGSPPFANVVRPLLKVPFEPFEDRYHNFICPLAIYVEVDAVF
jgi:hypothetical protein